MRWLWVAVILFYGTRVQASPQDALDRAYAHASTLDGLNATTTRYLYLGHIPAHERIETWEVASGHVNHLSLEPLIAPTTAILANGKVLGFSGDLAAFKAVLPQCVMISVRLIDYRFSHVTWDSLAFQDPFMHSLAITENLYWPGGNGYKAGWYANTKKELVAAVPEDLDRKKYLALVTLTQSVCPVLYVDNFIWQTSQQLNRKVGYYGLQGITDRATFERVIGLDRKASADFTRDLLAAVAESGVTNEPRRVKRFEKIGGSAWLTEDNSLAIQAGNPLRIINGGYKHEAEEWVAHGANRLQKYGLFAANGTRQDTAPTTIAGTKRGRDNDVQIHVYRSCVDCHTNGGLQDIDCFVRNLFIGTNIPLTGVDPATLVKLSQFYFRPLEPYLDDDRRAHSRAIAEACGLTSQEYSAKLTRVIARYSAARDMEHACRELGCSVAELQQALNLYIQVQPAQTLDIAISNFRLPRARQKNLPLSTWHEEIIVAKQALKMLKR